MGRIVVTEFVTLDGVMQDPGGGDTFERGGWAFRFDRGAEGDTFKVDELMASDAQLLGRVTYEGFAKAWPNMEGMGEFGEKFNAMPKFVMSSKPLDPEWNNSTRLEGELGSEVAKLKEHFERDILVSGSATLVRSLLAENLVDELRLMVFPVVLGTGKRLFADEADMLPLELVETKQSASVAMLTLRRKES